ncbi:MAG: hypothetical protein ABJF11_11680 [Reichenbachiella sp.]|uniref:hypothetical protein n=1 Tax=Reichenbachiella sp. TaxID=2184521 RepID=UPI0032666011
MFPNFESEAKIVRGDASLLNFRSDILYLIGHSNEKSGIKLADGNTLSPLILSDLITRSHHYKPRLLFLNTCYGIESGIAAAVKKAGVRTVIAANGTIPIEHMTQYAEKFFECWSEGTLAVSKALEVVNQNFKDNKIQFTYLGNGRQTFRSIHKL